MTRELALISHLFTIAIKEWQLPLQNVIQNIRKPKQEKGRDRRLSTEEEVYLLQACQQSKASAIETIVRLAIEKAMRQLGADPSFYSLLGGAVIWSAVIAG